MASTVLPNGIIVPEKFSRDWYADLYHNWQELDNLLAGGGANDGTLTIQKNGTTVGTFSANQATDETINIEVPDVNNGTLTIQQNGTTVDTFTANSSSDKTVNIQCVDLTSNQTVGGNKEFTGTTTAHDVIPSATDTYDLGSSSTQWNNAYIKSLTINGSQFLPNGYNKKKEVLTSVGKNVDFYNSENDIYFGARIRISDPTSTSQNNSSSLVFECQEFLPWYNGSSPIGNASQLWGQIYSTNSTISTSDKRLKNSVKDIDDKLLDAWGNIEPKQYKFNDSTEKKGEKARFHTGYLAQDIQAECEKQGVNASDYGLFCYDEWEEQEEESEEIETEKDGKIIKEKRVIQPKREKGDRYSLRYEELFVIFGL